MSRELFECSRCRKVHIAECEDVLSMRAALTTSQQELAEAREKIRGWKEVNEDHKRLVRELDVLLNGEEGAAQQASLCDIVGQVRKAQITGRQEFRRGAEYGYDVCYKKHGVHGPQYIEDDYYLRDRDAELSKLEQGEKALGVQEGVAECPACLGEGVAGAGVCFTCLGEGKVAT